MTKNVQIIIEGILGGEGEVQKIVTKVEGTYHYKNEKHFIQYEEYNEEHILHKNSIKISSKEIVMTKKGPHGTQMTFDLSDTTITRYQTPYGDFTFGIHTKKIELREEENLLGVDLIYDLTSEEGTISVNQVLIKVESLKE